jgi:hypothetical protein
VEGRADQQQRESRERVRDRVDKEGQRARHAKERAAQRWADQQRARFCRLILGDRDRQLRRRHDARERCRLGQTEERVEGALDQADTVELERRQTPSGQGQRYARKGQRPPDIAEHHQAAAIPAVDDCPGRKREEHVGEAPQSADQPGPRRRARQREDEQWQRQLRCLRAQGGDALSSPEQQVVVVAPERHRRRRTVFGRVGP